MEAVDKRLDSMKEQLVDREQGVAHQELETTIEILTVKRNKLNESLGALKDADVLEWKSAMPQVEEARKRLMDDDSDGQ